MEIDNLKNKIGFQVGLIVYSGKDPEKAIEDLTQIAIDYHNSNIELSSLIAIQEYLLQHGANDEAINDKIKQLINKHTLT